MQIKVDPNIFSSLPSSPDPPSRLFPYPVISLSPESLPRTTPYNVLLHGDLHRGCNKAKQTPQNKTELFLLSHSCRVDFVMSELAGGGLTVPRLPEKR